MNPAMKIGQSIQFDYRLIDFEVTCAQAHARALERAKKISAVESAVLTQGLIDARNALVSDVYEELAEFEDTYSCLENKLEQFVGPLAGALRLGRARNDVAATTLRLWQREACREVMQDLRMLVEDLLEIGEVHAESTIIGYSHLQPARPITLGFLFAAHAAGFLRELKSYEAVHDLLDECPLGSGALSGTERWLDRAYLARELGFKAPSISALDAIGSRDFVHAFLLASVSLATRLSRFSAEIRFLIVIGTVKPNDMKETDGKRRIDDSFDAIYRCLGIAVSAANALANTISSLPLSYFRDLQEDKEGLFSTFDALCIALEASRTLAREIKTTRIENLDEVANASIVAADYAEMLTSYMNIPYKEAHAIVSSTYTNAVSAEPGEIGLLRPDFANLMPSLPTIKEALWSRSAPGGACPDTLRSDLEVMRSRLSTGHLSKSVA